MAKIVSLGAALQDIFLVDHDDLAPTQIGSEAVLGKLLVGSEIDIDKLYYMVGGSGMNSAINFARHGHEAILVSNIAKDSAGHSVLKALNTESIDSSYMNLASRKNTGTSIILLDSNRGERTVLTCHGAAGKFDNFSEDILDEIQPDWLYATSLNGDVYTLSKFFERAKSLGIKIAFNPGGMEIKESKKIIGLLQDVDLLIVNKKEAHKIVGGAVLAEQLYHLNNYVDMVIITDGAMGGIATNGSEAYRFGIYEDIKVKDTTGAGDAFGAGFLAHFAAGKSFRSSLIFASANATSVVSKIGASSGVLTGAESLHPMPIQKI